MLDQLRGQQIDLEMQNEELRRVQADLEASRARYFDLYDLAPVGYITLNDSGSIIESNLRAASLFGATHSRLNGRHFSRSIAGVDADAYYLAHRLLFQSGAPQVCELRLKRCDGSIFWGRLEMSLSPMATKGAPEASRIVIIDISDRKLAEQRFDAFMDHTPAVASIVDEEGRYVYANPALQRYTGRGADAWAGKTFAEVWPVGIAQRLKQEHSRVLLNGVITSETETLPFGAQERVNQVLRFPFSGPHGKKLVGSVSIDVTERYRLESALREANVQLAAEKAIAERATNAKSQFLSAMSHEIRTPLNGVIGMAGLLLQTELTAEQLGYAGVVADSAELLLGLVNNVLDLAKIEAGKLELDESPLDLECLVEDALALVTFKAHEKSLELVCRYPEPLPRHFIGDAGRLRQILMNLLSNAVKFTPSGHVLVEVDVSSPVAGVSDVQLSIRDTGIGISEEKLSHLFTQFGQGDTSIAGRYGGSGLGLSIVKQMAELMGGQVGVDSVAGKGSTFRCKIPLRVQEPATTSTAAKDESLTGVSVLFTGAGRISGIVASEWCRRWGMNVRHCGVAQLPISLAIARQDGRPYELVVVDGGMEVLQQVSREIQIHAGGSPPKFILISSDPLDKTNSSAANAVLSTPVRTRVLREMLCKLIDRPVRGNLAANYLPHRGPSSIPKLGPCKVLVTDDNVVNQTLACALLRKMGCEVDTAADGLAAVKKVGEREYDLVFMDCVMPEMDGFAATKAIRRLAGRYGSVPIVALTASATNEDRDHCLAVGMNDFLTKPIRSEQLAQCLTKWLTGLRQ